MATVPPPPPAVEEPAVAETEPAEAEAEAVPPPLSPAPVCNCGSSSHYVFDLPTDVANPRVTTVLGRAPEFGNLHSLDPAGFFNKLI